MGTESRNPRSKNLDRMSASEIVRLMNEEESCVVKALDEAAPAIAEAAERAAAAFRAGGRVIYVGAGTSGRVATADAAEMPPTFGISSDRFVALIAGGVRAGGSAIEDAEDDREAAVVALNSLRPTTDDVLIGLAASGSTPYVVSAIRHAREKGLFTVGIANNPRTPVLEEADLAILLDTGPEVLTGSTRLKAGTSQKLALNRISTIAMVLNGKVISNLMVDVKAKNEKLKDRCARIVCALSSAVTKDEALALLAENDWSIRRVLDRLPVAA